MEDDYSQEEYSGSSGSEQEYVDYFEISKQGLSNTEKKIVEVSSDTQQKTLSK